VSPSSPVSSQVSPGDPPARSETWQSTLAAIARLAVCGLADSCAVDLVDDAGVVRRAAVVEVTLRPPLDPAHVVRAVATGCTQRVGASLVVPLVARAKTLGAMSFVRAVDAATHRHDETVIAEQIACAAAIAVESERMLHVERRAADAVAQLQVATASLSEAVTPDDVARVAVEKAMAAIGAAWAGLFWHRGGHDGRDGAGHGAGAYAMQLAQAASADGAMVTAALLDAPSAITLPLVARGRVVAELKLGFDGKRVLDEDDRALLATLAQQCAIALERARLYEDIEATGMRFKALAEASKLLQECSLDVNAVLEGLARVAADVIGDACVVLFFQEDGVPKVVAAHHHDPEARPALERMVAAPPQRDGVQRRVFETAAVVRDDAPNEAELAATGSDARREYIERHGIGPFLIVPVMGEGRVIGSLGISRVRGGKRYSEEEEWLAVELASRASLHIEKANLYRASQEAAVRADNANRAKDDFLSIVSHELRTPLNAIVGWSHILSEAKDRDTAMLERGLAVIRRNARTQVTIIEDILDVARIVTGKMRMVLHPVDLGAIVERAIDAVRPTATARGIEIEVTIAPQVGVLGDEDRLQQVVWNLLANALKFTPEGGHVHVVVERVGSGASVSVRDDGVGIAARDLPYVFDRFRQADSSATRSHGGLGLGLSIVRHLVEAHGGSVRVESEGLGRGATFVLSLPVTAAAVAARTPNDETPRTQRRPSPMRPPPTGTALSGLSVLIVDDDADATELCACVIASEGAAAVSTAHSVAEALEILRSFSPNVLVGDLGMPVEDGIALIQKVRALASPVARVPAIALTAYARPEDARRALDAGYTRHLAKPATPAALVSAVAELAKARAASAASSDLSR
jgi:signal transduction histidine kinase/CheY-like chemotaxis protein